MKTSWEPELAQLLGNLLAVQDDLLEILSAKRDLLREADSAGLAELAPKEEQLIVRLQECVRQREELLKRAGEEGLPSSCIRDLAKSLPRDERRPLQQKVQLASGRARLLRHQSLTNWVVVQKTLIHLSQLLEIIATGGRLQPTYGEGEPGPASGSLVDRAA